MVNALIRFKTVLTKALEWLLIVAVALLLCDVVWGVFTRYVMGEQAKWSEELARFLLIWVALIGSAVAFGSKSHLGVDYLTEKFVPEIRKAVAVLVHLIVLFFAISIFIYGGGRVVIDALRLEQMTPALGWKMGYVYLALPIAGFFIVLYTIEDLFETLLTKTSVETSNEERGLD
ncbi:TRAP transporter small permease [Rubellicoccus peritrichatus]|uniref:TRAP transporter small permease n=1 Tax=Rubellicoccus peritrichatus TaxID=3080537 RepID=A0AAQ3QVI8_9BACT|nr:TRAP transporter small permease [Puniceicoccus sp. CR14]WOO40847.1 TRAP transporter small permease [Puniceicoccus sp. CR14]